MTKLSFKAVKKLAYLYGYVNKAWVLGTHMLISVYPNTLYNLRYTNNTNATSTKKNKYVYIPYANPTLYKPLYTKQPYKAETNMQSL